MSKSLSFAVIGCGSRGRTYMRIARQLGHRIVAISDTSESALAVMKEIAGENDPQEFASGEELLATGKRLADVALVSTQDAQHFGHASAALRLGYDVLLEKPAAQSSEECEELARIAKENNCKLILCFVLRYTPFYRTIKGVIDAGKIGDIVTIQASEGVGPFHNVHSYVRGKWSVTAESTPMIIAKCSHDTDLLAWFAGSRAVSVTSHEDTSHFRPDKAPEGATDRCTDGCPHVGICSWDAHRYLTDQRNWVRHVRPDAATMDDAAVLDWIKTSKWGRCAYRCDHDTPDHQVVGVHFENGITADLTMTAFDTGRWIRIYGTAGVLEAWSEGMGGDGEPSIQLRPHGGQPQCIAVQSQDSGDYHGHGGGDFGLIHSLPELLADGSQDFIEGHRIGFAADLAAKENRVVSP
ncbi:Gfo/Idh/MocA family oxidoreductase [Akkermansiaceae bacterium]|nr:Gfo/Idh/MocA family oxidoreductase [Akkermansiaceae bacterium]